MLLEQIEDHPLLGQKWGAELTAAEYQRRMSRGTMSSAARIRITDVKPPLEIARRTFVVERNEGIPKNLRVDFGNFVRNLLGSFLN